MHEVALLFPFSATSAMAADRFVFVLCNMAAATAASFKDEVHAKYMLERAHESGLVGKPMEFWSDKNKPGSKGSIMSYDTARFCPSLKVHHPRTGHWDKMMVDGPLLVIVV